MDRAELDRLRHFALTAGLALLTYTVTGITPDPEGRVSLFGMPFRVSRPDLLPIGLFVAAAWGLVRFYYYGAMRTASPYRVRRDKLNQLQVQRQGEGFWFGRNVWMYFGRVRFTTDFSYCDRSQAERDAEALRSIFPRFLGARVSATVSPPESSVDDDGNVFQRYDIAGEIPARCKVAALFEDADYFLPVIFKGSCWSFRFGVSTYEAHGCRCPLTGQVLRL